MRAAFHAGRDMESYAARGEAAGERREMRGIGVRGTLTMQTGGPARTGCNGADWRAIVKDEACIAHAIYEIRFDMFRDEENGTPRRKT
jgi:hypothetical protein